MKTTVLFALLALISFGDRIGPAAAQTWPERPVTMVVPFAPGGGTDLLGRIVATRLSELLGKQVVVENVGGAGGMLGSARVVKSAPDGYTMVIGTTADAINQSLYKTPLYDFATDLVPAGLMGSQPTVLLAMALMAANDHITVNRLAAELDVSKETIRRDLRFHLSKSTGACTSSLPQEVDGIGPGRINAGEACEAIWRCG